MIFPVYIYVKKNSLLDCVEELKNNQWKSFEEIKKIQKVKLNNLLIHAYNSVPYYRRVIDEKNLSLKNLADYDNFKQLPFLTKSIIREKTSDIISTDLKGNKLYKNSTSGSTGENLYFFTDKKSSIYRNSAVIVNQEWTGFSVGDGKVLLWGAPMDKMKAKSLRGRIHGIVARVLFLSSYDLTPQIMDNYIERINKFRPRLLISYPGPLEVFADYVKEKKIILPSIKSIITSAEQLFSHQRTLFEKVFNAQVYDRYGSRELGDTAHECSEHCGLHVNSSRALVEILDDEGNNVPPGEIGELYITDLDNYGMPMIRYQIGDRAAWSEKMHCKCGRSLPLLSRIEGRSMDVIKTKTNLKLGGTFWTILFRTKRGIKQFQVVQKNTKGIFVYYVPDNNFSKLILKFFENIIKEKCGNDFNVIFIKKNSLKKTVSGKHRIVISEC